MIPGFISTEEQRKQTGTECEMDTLKYVQREYIIGNRENTADGTNKNIHKSDFLNILFVAISNRMMDL